MQKQQRYQKRIKLRETQENDKLMKQQRRNSDIPAKSMDFAASNVLSYVYEKKDHKAYEYRKRNDHLQNLMKDQFSNTNFGSKDMERAIMRDEAENNRKVDEVQKKRLDDRKQKELEAKKFLDMQIAEKD